MELAPQIDHFLDRVFDSLASPDGLVRALKDIRAFFNARQILIQTSVFRAGQLGVNIASDGVPADALFEYHAHFEAEDPWTLAAARMGILKAGLVVRGSDLVPPDELRRTRFYTAFLSRHSVLDLLTAVIEMPADGAQPPTVISMHRGPEQPQFTRKDVDTLRALYAHLRRALQLHCRLAHDLSVGASLDAAFHSMQVPMLFLDQNAHVVRANPAAQACIEEARFWRCDVLGSLFRSEPSAASGWRAVADDVGLLSGAPSTEHLVTSGDGAAVVVGLLRTIRPPLLSAMSALPVALATLRPIELTRDRALVQSRFGLTSKELRVAELLVSGQDAAGISEEMEVQLSTVRTHIAALLAKCDCSSQLQLQARLRGLPASWTGAEPRRLRH